MLEQNTLNYILENSHKSMRQLERETGIGRGRIAKIFKENGVDKNNRLSDNEKRFILDNSHLTVVEIAEMINRPRTTIQHFLNRNNIYHKKIFDPDLEEFKSVYYKYTSDELAEYYSVDRHTILKYAKRNNMKTKGDIRKERGEKRREEVVKKKRRHNYFKKIDSHQKAYFVGLIASDGSVYNKKEKHPTTQNTMQVSLKTHDEYILDVLHKELETGRKCHRIASTGVSTFQIASDQIYDDLSQYGIVPNKTWDLNIKNIPKEFIPSFLLGYFDGDGSIYDAPTISKTNVGICGTESCINSISKLLKNVGLEFSIIEDKRNHKYKGRFFNITFKNTSEKYCFLKTIYANECECLHRKKKLAMEFIYKVENNATNRYENVKAVNDYNKRRLN